MEFHGTLKVLWNLTPTPNSMEFHGIHQQRKTYPWNSMEFKKVHGTPSPSSMEFHGISWNPHSLVINSMEFYGTMIVSRNLVWSEIPWNSIEQSVEFHGTVVPPNTQSSSSMEFDGTLETHHLHWHQVSVDFHGNISWNYMEFCRQIRCNQVPWTSMEIGDCQFHLHPVPLDFYGFFFIEVHGTLPSPKQMSPSSVDSHGTSRETFQITPRFHGIPWNTAGAKSNVTKFHGIPCNFETSIEFQLTSGSLGLPLNISWNSWVTKSHGISRNLFLII